MWYEIIFCGLTGLTAIFALEHYFETKSYNSLAACILSAVISLLTFLLICGVI